MNYFAHALPFLDRPYFVAGTGVPDWLTVADRRVRIRSKHAEAFLNDADPCTAEVAAGVLQHLRDDARFHAHAGFAETSLELTARVRDALGGETGLAAGLPRPPADGTPAGRRPDRRRSRPADRVLPGVGRGSIPSGSRRPSTAWPPGPPGGWPRFVELFRRERVLCDYREDGKLMVRLNQVLRRVKLEPLPDALRRPAAGRQRVGGGTKGRVAGGLYRQLQSVRSRGR